MGSAKKKIQKSYAKKHSNIYPLQLKVVEEKYKKMISQTLNQMYLIIIYIFINHISAFHFYSVMQAFIYIVCSYTFSYAYNTSKDDLYIDYFNIKWKTTILII